MFAALTISNTTREILKYLYIRALPKIAEGPANKLFVVPPELNAVASLGATFSAADNGRGASPIPTLPNTNTSILTD